MRTKIPRKAIADRGFSFGASLREQVDGNARSRRVGPIVGVVAGAYIVVLAPVVAMLISVLCEDRVPGRGTLLGLALLLIGHSILVAQRLRR